MHLHLDLTDREITQALLESKAIVVQAGPVESCGDRLTVSITVKTDPQKFIDAVTQAVTKHICAGLRLNGFGL